MVRHGLLMVMEDCNNLGHYIWQIYVTEDTVQDVKAAIGTTIADGNAAAYTNDCRIWHRCGPDPFGGNLGWFAIDIPDIDTFDTASYPDEVYPGELMNAGIEEDPSNKDFIAFNDFNSSCCNDPHICTFFGEKYDM